MTSNSTPLAVGLAQQVPDVGKLSNQNSNLHLNGWDVFQLDDLRDVREDAVQPARRRRLQHTANQKSRQSEA